MQVFLIITRANEGFKLNFINLAAYFLLDDESYCVIIKISQGGDRVKKTLTRKSLLRRKRKHGFRRRMRSAKGRAILRRRRQKGRRILSV